MQLYRLIIYSFSLYVMTLIVLPATAHAYTDPGSGMLLWQLLCSFIIGLLFYLKSIIFFIKKYFNRKHDR